MPQDCKYVDGGTTSHKHYDDSSILNSFWKEVTCVVSSFLKLGTKLAKQMYEKVRTLHGSFLVSLKSVKSGPDFLASTYVRSSTSYQ